jgi:hypothetical protein
MKDNLGDLTWQFVRLQPAVCTPLVALQKPLLVGDDKPIEAGVFIGSTEQTCTDGHAGFCFYPKIDVEPACPTFSAFLSHAGV